MSDYLLQIKVRNGPLVRAMRRRGFTTAVALARAAGTTNTAIGNMLALSEVPLLATGDWRPHVMRVADVLQVMPEDLYPPHHVHQALERSTAEMDVSLADIQQISGAGGTPEDLLSRKEFVAALDRAIEVKCSPRNGAILRKRFGLDGPEMTYEEIAKESGVTRERIRQREMKALRDLKRSNACRQLASYIGARGAPLDAEET